MRVWRSFLFFVFVMIVFSDCVDRIQFDTAPAALPVAVEGFISDQPGPYEVRVNRAYDIESKNTPKVPLSVKKIQIVDNLGNQETLTEVQTGVYRTSPAGIRGVVGRSYRITLDLLDGRSYESIPDTLRPTGVVESVQYEFLTNGQPGSSSTGFQVRFNAKAGSGTNNYYLWRFVGTYKVDTNPELADEPCGESRCPRPRPCSGYVLSQGSLVKAGPCTCCTCWVNIFNDQPIISDNRFIENGRFQEITAAFIPLDKWIFLYKVHAAVEQRSLSRRSFLFWKAIKDQKEAVNSLFQPIAGRVPINFVQRAGPVGTMEGIFYATSIHSKGVFITRNDVPNASLIPAITLPYRESCLDFPYSTTIMPAFWN